MPPVVVMLAQVDDDPPDHLESLARGVPPTVYPNVAFMSTEFATVYDVPVALERQTPDHVPDFFYTSTQTVPDPEPHERPSPLHENVKDVEVGVDTADTRDLEV